MIWRKGVDSTGVVLEGAWKRSLVEGVEQAGRAVAPRSWSIRRRKPSWVMVMEPSAPRERE
jgi:hypothetical protein